MNTQPTSTLPQEVASQFAFSAAELPPERNRFSDLADGGPAAELAMAQLYDTYAPRFRAFLRLRGVSPEQSEDLIQDVFLRLLEASPRLARVESPRAYLWCALRNAFHDQARQKVRERRRLAAPPAGDPEEGDDPSFECWLERTLGSAGNELERIDHYECIGRALERFRRQDPDRAAAIELAAIEGFEGRELAEALGKSYGAAREFLSQARRALRTLVQRMCGGLYN